jgi:hypothetical protein
MKSVALAMCLIAASAFADRPTALEITDRGQPVYMRTKSIQRDQADPTIVRLKGMSKSQRKIRTKKTAA